MLHCIIGSADRHESSPGLPICRRCHPRNGERRRQGAKSWSRSRHCSTRARGRAGRRRSRSRARPGSGSRRSGAQPSRRRAARACACSPRGRPSRSAGSPTPAWATCSTDVLDDVLPGADGAAATGARGRAPRRGRGGRPVDPRALGVAVRSALQLLAEDGLVVAIDDLQWLDASSASALAFALRRLPEADMLLLWTRRLDDAAQPSAVENALDADADRRASASGRSASARSTGSLREPASAAAAAADAAAAARGLGREPVLCARARAGARLRGRPSRSDAAAAGSRAAGGARSHAARRLHRRDARRARARLRARAADAGAARCARASSRPPSSRRSREQVIELERRHRPVHAPAARVGALPGAVAAASGSRRIAALAELVDDPRRPRASPRALDRRAGRRARRRARARGDAAAAPGRADRRGRARRARVPADAGRRPRRRDRRAIAAARVLHLATGESSARASLADGAACARAAPGRSGPRRSSPRPTSRARTPARRSRSCARRLREAARARRLQATIHQRLSLQRPLHARDWRRPRNMRALPSSSRSSSTTTRSARRRWRGLALIRFNAGSRTRSGSPSRRTSSRRPPRDQPGPRRRLRLAHVLLWSLRARARPRAARGPLRATGASGTSVSAADALWYLALVELRAGRLALRGRVRAPARELAPQYARRGEEMPHDLFPIGARRRAPWRARACARARRARCVGSPSAHASALRRPLRVLGDRGALERRRGGGGRALRGRRGDAADAADWGEPTMSWWRADQVEALLELGRDRRRRELARRVGGGRARLGRGWVLAHATRCRGLVAAARGDVDERDVAARARRSRGTRRSATRSAAARALLALGVVRRRARQKRAAREAIEAARAAFEELGAAGWAERARDELGADRRPDAHRGPDPGGAARRRPRRGGTDERARSPRRSSSPSARSRAT